MLVYRATKRAHARDLMGTGARLEGGRWNSVGNAMLYGTSSRSLALLEVLAHSTMLPSEMAMVALELPARLRIPVVNTADLPAGWDDLPTSPASQQFGDAFLKEGKHLAIRVPSVIVPDEENVLINPFHPRAKEIEIISIEELSVDTRLK